MTTMQYSNKLLVEANKELKKAIRSQLAYLIGKSHDLRSPLNTIIGFAELLLDEVPGKINEDQRQSLNDILKSSQRLLDVINGILEQLEKKSQSVL